MHEPNLNTPPAPHDHPQSPRRNDRVLDVDADIASAQVLAALTGDGRRLPADAFRQLAERNRALIDAPEEEIRDSLTRQATLLEALWLHYARRAADATRPDHAALLAKTALACQRSLVGVLGALRQMSEDQKNSAALDA